MRKEILGTPTGTMQNRTIELLQKTGMKIVLKNRKFNLKIENSDCFSSVFLMRPEDMPNALVHEKIRAGILGKDLFEESGLGKKLKIISELPFAKKTNSPARVVLFGKNEEFEDRKNILVASEYPKLSRKIFKNATIHFSSGGTEQKVAYLGYDYGVCVTETGDSLKDNGLVLIRELMDSPMILVAKEETSQLKSFGDLLLGVLKAEKHSLLKLNVEKVFLGKIVQYLPALKAPTISTLGNGNYSIETVVPRDGLGNLIITLKKIGGTDILVQNLDIID